MNFKDILLYIIFILLEYIILAIINYLLLKKYNITFALIDKKSNERKYIKENEIKEYRIVASILWIIIAIKYMKWRIELWIEKNLKN